MTESQLQLANDLQTDREKVYNQMRDMKKYIGECARVSFKTEDQKENFDAFKQGLLEQCDKYVEDQRESIDVKFKSI